MKISLFDIEVPEDTIYISQGGIYALIYYSLFEVNIVSEVADNGRKLVGVRLEVEGLNFLVSLKVKLLNMKKLKLKAIFNSLS